MRRRDFVKAIIASAAGWPLLARARQPTTPVSPVLGQPAVDAFMAEELFGVAHPDQLLSFSGTLNPATQKLMKGGSEVPYQVDGSKIIVRAEGGIAANSSNVWSVASGARSASAQVTVTDGGSYYEVDNGLVAFRTPKTITVGGAVLEADEPAEERQRIYAPTQVLAPIQGIRHRDGTWTGTGPNYIYSGMTWWSSQIPDPVWQYTSRGPCNLPATAATVEVLENGPLRAKIKMSYVVLRPMWTHGEEKLTLPSENGHYICTVTLEAGQQFIIVDQETDGRPAWKINMNTGVSADRARWRGHHAESIAQGHNYDGTVYHSGWMVVPTWMPRSISAMPAIVTMLVLAERGILLSMVWCTHACTTGTHGRQTPAGTGTPITPPERLAAICGASVKGAPRSSSVVSLPRWCRHVRYARLWNAH